MIRNSQSFASFCIICIILGIILGIILPFSCGLGRNPYFPMLRHIAPTSVVIVLPHTISKVSPFLTDSVCTCKILQHYATLCNTMQHLHLDLARFCRMPDLDLEHLQFAPVCLEDLKGAGAAAAAAAAPAPVAAAAPSFTPPPRVLEDFETDVSSILCQNLMEI